MVLFFAVDWVKLMRSDQSLGLEACELDHLAPFPGFIGDDFGEVGGRARHAVATQVGQSRLEFWIGEACIHSLIELVDDIDRRVLRRGDTLE